ncbi:gluconate 2-dehydrogenase subunit 3 family protein [Chitinophaga sp. Mgbs1]|uniref:Gluconate 2-dehydrogenase subunit 3 family protein n=1 Tax=Chitinophaga solisilvae TaxID=1233460 RepID=A0A433WDB0_9BACT|nr:gluconate 2-dehydrogenase subunit 3 family protein [Chitinophaga solisilvae]
MNRRKAIAGIVLFGGAVYAGVRGLRLFSTADLSQLPGHRALIAELAEMIIPRTDTPGAKDAAAEDFIITMIKDCTPRKSQYNFMQGLSDVTAYTRRHYGCTFMECTQEQRTEVIAHFEERDRPFSGLAGKVSRKLSGDAFFQTLKRYTIQGYCTSKQGATKGLAYDYVPGAFRGCVPLQPGQKCWAT